jgi:hypothetical protein
MFQMAHSDFSTEICVHFLTSPCIVTKCYDKQINVMDDYVSPNAYLNKVIIRITEVKYYMRDEISFAGL